MSVAAMFLNFSLLPFISGSPVDCNIVTRNEWGARPPNANETSLSAIPPHYVVIHHSATKSCNTTESCKSLVQSIQNYHMDKNNWNDIGYNFLVGGDGKIYEGRGYTTKGAHCIPFNRRSLGICILGTFTGELFQKLFENNELLEAFLDHLPSDTQLQAVKHFLSCSEENGDLADDYHLLGHRQATATVCPGNAFYAELEKWPHFDSNPKLE